MLDQTDIATPIGAEQENVAVGGVLLWRRIVGDIAPIRGKTELLAKTTRGSLERALSRPLPKSRRFDWLRPHYRGESGCTFRPGTNRGEGIQSFLRIEDTGRGAIPAYNTQIWPILTTKPVVSDLLAIG